jgi:hypothetical protein
MSARWWDGCDRAVVGRSRTRVVKEVIVVLHLECGHTQQADTSNQQAAICRECARLKREGAS